MGLWRRERLEVKNSMDEDKSGLVHRFGAKRRLRARFVTFR